MVELMPLASDTDVAGALGRDLTPSEVVQVQAKLVQASELFRNAANRTFTPGRKTVRLKVNAGEVRLPESPVVTVHSVTDDDGTAIEHTLFGVTITVPRCSARFVRVDYSFGSADVPALARETVAAMVARVMDVDKLAKAGLSQFQTTTGPFTDGGTFATWAVGAQVLMAPADIVAAESFRPPRVPSTVVHH